MKKVLLTLLTLSLVSFSGLQSSEKSSDTAYANCYTDSAQTGISPNNIIKLTKLDTPEKSGIKLSNDGGLVVGEKGSYFVTYRASISAQSSLALFKNGNAIASSAFSNITAISPVCGMTVINVDAGDKITLRNIDNKKVFNTIISSGSSYTPIPVSLSIVRL